MKSSVSLFALAACLALVATDAQAGPSITLYTSRNFKGESITVTRAAPNLDAYFFSNMARSARARGTWQLCSRPDYRGTCILVSGNDSHLDLRRSKSLRPK